jgi:hypothetical protein
MAIVNGDILLNLHLGELLVPELSSIDDRMLQAMLKYDGDVEVFPQWSMFRLRLVARPIDELPIKDEGVLQKNYKNQYTDCENFHSKGFLAISYSIKDLLGSANITNYMCRFCNYTNGAYLEYVASDERRKNNHEIDCGGSAVLLRNISKDYIFENTYIEFEHFLSWIAEKGDINHLGNEQRVSQFLTELFKSVPELCIENGDNFQPVLDLILKFFGKFGVDVTLNLLGHETIHTTLSNNLDDEIAENEINGRFWFDLNSLSKHWTKHGLAQADILHYAEIGKLQVCFDWKSKITMTDSDTKFPPFLSYSFEESKTISKLIKFKKLPLLPVDQHSDFRRAIHAYAVSNDSTSKYSRLASISNEDIRKFIAEGEIDDPRCHINEFKLNYYFDFLPINITEHQLLVTAREVRLFEKNVLGINDLCATDNQHKLKPTSNSDITDGAWLTLGILKELLLEHTDFKSKADVKAAIMAKHPKLRGISDRNLDDILKKGTDMLEEKSKRN